MARSILFNMFIEILQWYVSEQRFFPCNCSLQLYRKFVLRYMYLHNLDGIRHYHFLKYETIYNISIFIKNICLYFKSTHGQEVCGHHIVERKFWCFFDIYLESPHTLTSLPWISWSMYRHKTFSIISSEYP